MMMTFQSRNDESSSAPPPAWSDAHGFATLATPAGYPMAILQQSRMELPVCRAELEIMACLGLMLRHADAALMDLEQQPQQQIKIQATQQFLQRIEEKEERLDGGPRRAFATPSSLERRLERWQFDKIWSYAWKEWCHIHQQQQKKNRQYSYISPVESVFQKDLDEALTQGLLPRLKRGIHSTLRSSLEKRYPPQTLDRHPGAPQIIDWCHPSLYAFQNPSVPLPETSPKEDNLYTITQSPPWESFLGTEIEIHSPPENKVNDDNDNEGELNLFGPNAPPPHSSHLEHVSSAQGFQWLPSEFYVTEEEGTDENQQSLHCQINSYISGLHPTENVELYHDIAHLFAQAVPVLERALTHTWCGNNNSSNPPEIRQRRPRIRIPPYYGDLAREHQKVQAQETAMGASLFGNDSDDEEDKEEDNDPFGIPPFELPTYSELYHHVNLRNRPLQVAVKLATLELAPGENYTGGWWHVEGMLHDRIVATACCYLEHDNIMGGDLEFRTSIREPYRAVKPKQRPRNHPYSHDFETEQEGESDSSESSFNEEDENRHWRQVIFGLQEGDPLVQPRGSCETRPGRILAWPNLYQHRTQPVRLVDPTQPGRRTICCFFLVDPTLRIRSTATVPPQCWEWVSKGIHDALQPLVPIEAVRNKILDYVKALPPKRAAQNTQEEQNDGNKNNNSGSSYWFSYQDACQRRKELVAERSFLSSESTPQGREAFCAPALGSQLGGGILAD
mmetsp:Transcript_18410/g.38041  ORF Transcript_18410/g.38041 Transcript_18410/m.38041 type:complete len:732 (-) Transcript_18410:157-2352(-)